MWDPIWVDFLAFKLFLGILLTGFICGASHHIHFLNIFVSHKDQWEFGIEWILVAL